MNGHLNHAMQHTGQQTEHVKNKQRRVNDILMDRTEHIQTHAQAVTYQTQQYEDWEGS